MDNRASAKIGAAILLRPDAAFQPDEDGRAGGGRPSSVGLGLPTRSERIERLDRNADRILEDAPWHAIGANA
jgi:hypothetical protein